MRTAFAFQYFRAYEPHRYSRYRLIKKVIVRIGVIFFPVGLVTLGACLLIWGSLKLQDLLQFTFIGLFVIGVFDLYVLSPIYVLVVLWAWFYDRMVEKREVIAMAERTTKHFSIEQERGAQLLTEFQARAIGATIIAEQGATVYNSSFNNSNVVDRSTLIHSMNRVEDDAQLTDALKVVAGIVQNSNNSMAIETLNEFNKKIAGKDSKVTLRALWDQIVKLVPTVVEIGGAASKIAEWLNSPTIGSV